MDLYDARGIKRRILSPINVDVLIMLQAAIDVHCTVVHPNTADLRTGEKAAVFRRQRYWESYITCKTLIRDLKMGGGIGRAAVLGGAVNVLANSSFLHKQFSLQYVWCTCMVYVWCTCGVRVVYV